MARASEQSWKIRTRWGITGLAVAGALLLAACDHDTDPDAVTPGFEVGTEISGLSLPTGVEFAPDGRVFVIEKRGTVLGFDSLEDSSSAVIADLGGNIHNYEDRGLLGLALDPDFPTSPHLYVFYTLDRDDSWGDTCPNPPGTFNDGCVVNGRLSRLTVNEDNELVGDEEVILEDLWCAQFPSHTVGDLEFMEDGSLLVSAGDGGDYNSVDYGQHGGSTGSPTPANPCGDPPFAVGDPQTLPTAQGGALRSQALATAEPVHTYDGAILRIDPDTGEAHPTNPLVGAGDPLAERIVAHGLRNPYRITSRPGTSEVWLGDVGWGDWEEINRITDVEDEVVENFGWPCFEGAAVQGSYAALNLDLCDGLYDGSIPSGLTEPYYAYRHGAPPSPEVCGDGAGSSVTAISFYDGALGSYPETYDGALLFGDYVRECIWAMPLDASGNPDASHIEPIAAGIQAVDLEQGPDGDMFAVDIVAGSIRRIAFTGAEMGPTARVEASPDNGSAPLEVSFDGTGSTPNIDGDLTYEWDLDGDGSFDDATGPTATHTYTEAGTIAAGLQVTNENDLSDTDTVTIHVGNSRPEPVIEAPVPGTEWGVDDVLDLAGSATDAEEGELSDDALEWQVNLHHCYTTTDCHAHFLETITGQGATSIIAPNHEYPSYLELVLTATDSAGLTGETSLRLDPRTVDIVLESEPQPVLMGLGSKAFVTPSTQTVIEGSTLTLIAPSPHPAEGGGFIEFDSWSDGGERIHQITATEPATYTATYVPSEGSDPDVVYVSDVSWVSEVNGFGPAERDMSNGDEPPGDGGPLSVRGQVFDKGVGAHAESEIVVDVPPDCASFEAVVGVNDSVGENGSVVYSVLGDGAELATTPVLEGGTSPAHPLSVDLSGVEQVTLAVGDAGDNNFWDHADWGDARFVCGDSGPPDPPGGFELPVSLPVGDRPHSIVSHDLNDDGLPDLVAGVPGEDAVAVFLNTGDGFAPADSYPTGPGTFPKHAEVGDITGDGVPDLVAANQDSTTGVDVTVFPGLGDGTFESGVPYEACSRPHQTALGDVDGDGSLDVMVACWGGGVVSVLLNDGSGTLGEPVDYAAADAPHSLVLEDMDGDGALDAAVAAYGDNRVAVLAGNGDGTFGAPSLYWSGLGPHNLVSGDLNGDGNVDLVVTAENDSAVGVLLGAGDGTFADTAFYDVGLAPKATALGDVNGDAIDDLVTANTHGNYPDGSEPTTLTVLLGVGDGTFEEGFTLGNDLTPFSVTVGDLYGDGTVAIATANWHSDDIKVHRRP